MMMLHFSICASAQRFPLWRRLRGKLDLLRCHVGTQLPLLAEGVPVADTETQMLDLP